MSNQKNHKNRGGNGNNKKRISLKGLTSEGSIKGVVITHEYPLAQQIKSFKVSLYNKLAHKVHSVITNCIRNKEALKDDDKKFTAK